jgi:NAD(P)-dependent dehydrogenase (short-subunit alcohol dehydrogenase family)
MHMIDQKVAIAIVTGGSSGIGKATAIAVAKEGVKIVVAARRVKEGEETVDLVREAGSDGIFVCAVCGGAIVNNSSVAGIMGFPQNPIYVASKHAVLGLTRSFAL